VVSQPASEVYFTHDEVSALAIAVGGRGTLILTLAYCGLRWGKTVGLRVKDLDMLRRRINVTVNAVEVGDRIEVGTPKTHKRRSVPFPALLSLPLAQQCEGKPGDDLVFSSRHGTHERRWHNAHGWFPAAVSAGGLPPITPHTLRHTAAGLAVSAGANVKAVPRMLGHASASMTPDVYSDLFDDNLDAVAECLGHGLAHTVVGRLWASRAEK